jgi:hypothetical protein
MFRCAHGLCCQFQLISFATLPSYLLPLTEILNSTIPSASCATSRIPTHLLEIVEKATLRYQSFTSNLSAPQNKNRSKNENSEQRYISQEDLTYSQPKSSQTTSILSTDVLKSSQSTNKGLNPSYPTLFIGSKNHDCSWQSSMGTKYFFQQVNIQNDYNHYTSVKTYTNGMSSSIIEASTLVFPVEVSHGYISSKVHSTSRDSPTCEVQDRPLALSSKLKERESAGMYNGMHAKHRNQSIEFKPISFEPCISHQELYFPRKHSSESEINNRPTTDNNMRLLYTANDESFLSLYQCLVRKQIEVFAAEKCDVKSTAQGRNTPIRLGQVGIRCRHCSMLPPQHRTKASTYYPAKLLGVYQAAQNIAVTHLSGYCPLIPDSLKDTLIQLRLSNKATPGRGKLYWANSMKTHDLYESDGILKFKEKEK